MRNLASLVVGDKGEMVQIFDNSLEQKLLEMGCTPGEKFEVVRQAPFGGPIAILISSYVLSVRKEDARNIAVKLLKSE